MKAKGLVGLLVALASAFAVFAATGQGAATVDPEVWVGSPFTGNWPSNAGCSGAKYPSPPNGDCSLPKYHHTPYNGDGSAAWAADITAKNGATTPVLVYAAPQITSQTITAKVQSIGLACASGKVADGGYRVTVAFYRSSTKIGTATYAHIQPTVSAGQAVNRWGGKIGTVGKYTASKCWSAPHVHLELINAHNYSCFNKDYTPGYKLNPHDFVGFLGGKRTTGPRKPCP